MCRTYELVICDKLHQNNAVTFTCLYLYQILSQLHCRGGKLDPKLGNIRVIEASKNFRSLLSHVS